jgi:Ser/Thr protein kinase RdoA (MazF antagonist)
MNNILEILKSWGLGNATVTPMEQRSESTWDIDGKFVLKRFRTTEDLSRSMEFSKRLTSHGIPVITFVPAGNGQLTSPDGLYCLMTKLPGKHRDFFKEQGLAQEMGRELARLHVALADIESTTSCYDSNLLNDWQNRIKPSLSDVSENMVQSVDSDFCKIFPKLPRQLIHRDVHCHNVLFENGRLTGWLDFDITERNVRIFDIAYLLSGLLIGNTHNPVQIKKWCSICDNLLLGYDEVNRLSDKERDALPVMMIMIEFLFVWFWGEQGNAEQRNVALELAKWLYDDYKGGDGNCIAM